MNITQRFISWLIVSFGITALLVVITPVVFAQSGGNVSSDGGTSASKTGDSLKISPLRNDVTIRPGETGKVTVYIQNLNPVPVTLKPINNDFIAGSKEDGTPSIILEENEFAPTHSLKKFMLPLDNVTVGPGERKALDVTIQVPANAQAGGYYGAVRFAPALPDGSESVNVSGSVASLVVLTVPGDIVENLTLKEFSITQKGKNVGRFVNSPDDLKAVVRLENKGNIHVAPFGDVFVQKDTKVLSKTTINDITPKGLVLPDSVRQWELPLSDVGNFGKYTVSATVGYGTSGETLNLEKTLWVIPAIYIFGAIIALIVLLAVIIAIVLALKAYKRRILRRSRRRY